MTITELQKKLDAKHDNRDFEEIKQELYNDFGL